MNKIIINALKRGYANHIIGKSTKSITIAIFHPIKTIHTSITLKRCTVFNIDYKYTNELHPLKF